MENVKVVKESGLRFPVKFNNDIDILKALVMLYCQRRVFLKEIPRIPRAKLINMLAIYIKYGYNQESKEKLREIFNEVDMANINSWNRELRTQGFIYKDTFNENVSILNDDLKQIKLYYEAVKGKIDIKVIFSLTD